MCVHVCVCVCDTDSEVDDGGSVDDKVITFSGTDDAAADADAIET